jgi:hypothetical protein
VKKISLILALSFFMTKLNAQSPSITSLTPITEGSIGQYNRYEVRVNLTANIANPYDYDAQILRGLFKSPTGREKTIEGFFIQDFDLNTANGSLTTKGSGEWRIRFAPDEIGAWEYAVSVTTKEGTSAVLKGNFTCEKGNNKGFIRKNESFYLNFDNNEQYIPVGQNLAWQQSNPYLDYKKWLENMGSAKANFARLWLCHWGLGIEWKPNTGGGYEGLKRYKQNNAWYLDWVLEKCREQNINTMLCINHHGQVSTTVNPNWNENPYNAANGGPCAQTKDFFTNATAKQLHKNRLRYIVARWGFSPNIMAWELFNEVGYTDDFTKAEVKTAVKDWHNEMALFLKDKDPFKHLVTTSFGNYEDPSVFQLPSMDFSQNHAYIDAPNVEQALADISRNNIKTLGKPTLNGEFGIDASPSSLSTLDPKGIHIHNSLWATAFSGAMGAGASWWWDTYLEPKNLYVHYTPLSIFLSKLKLKADKYRFTPATSRGGNGSNSVIFTPAIGFGQPTEATFAVDTMGNITPSASRLGTYLFGYDYNTQYRNPPFFNLNFKNATQFKVKTGNAAGEKPNITIYIDGIAYLTEAASINKTYTINIPAGKHTIKVDNLGKDWISIAGYEIAGIAAGPLSIYALKSENGEAAAGWIHHRKYNWKDVKDTGIPTAAKGAQVIIDSLKTGNYDVFFYDCATNNTFLSQLKNITTQNNRLVFDAPDVLWDMAFTVQKTGLVNTDEVVKTETIKVYPNPIRLGEKLTVNTEGVTFGLKNIVIYSINGSLIKQEKVDIQGGILEIDTQMLHRGYFILQIKDGLKVWVCRFVVE